MNLTKTIVLAVLSIFLFSGTYAQNKKVIETIPTKTSLGATPGKMNEFMKMLDGEDGSSKKAAQAYCSQAVLNSLEESNSLTFYDYLLREATITSIDYNCCIMEAKAGLVVRRFNLCWEDNKIVSLKDLGIK